MIHSLYLCTNTELLDIIEYATLFGRGARFITLVCFIECHILPLSEVKGHSYFGRIFTCIMEWYKLSIIYWGVASQDPILWCLCIDDDDDDCNDDDDISDDDDDNNDDVGDDDDDDDGDSDDGDEDDDDDDDEDDDDEDDEDDEED